jgi:D-tyrosyl-tRNA(Tyr) deacylase
LGDDEHGATDIGQRTIGQALLVVSQFTLYADARKGRRPSFTAAAPPEQAEPLIDYLVACLRRQGLPVATGIFRAEMQVSLVNDGPVTIWLER